MALQARNASPVLPLNRHRGTVAFVIRTLHGAFKPFDELKTAGHGGIFDTH